ncbi:MAG: ATP synthase F1 subunit gamma [Verrucomicrobiota bacterium]
MANTRDIRRRIKSIKNTAQITKAMQMVAAAKMRKAQMQASAGRPYSTLLDEIATHMQGAAGDFTHPLIQGRPVKKRAVLVITTDKGLCGGLNTNLLKEIQLKHTPNTVYVSVGRKGRLYLARTGKELLADFEIKDGFTFRDSKRVSSFLLDLFEKGEIDEIEVAYSKYINAMVQQPTIFKLAPIGADKVKLGTEEPAKSGSADALFEPSAEELLGKLLPFYIHFEVYQNILNAKASEHSARMVAMKNATDNAKQIVKDLTLLYNKVRQASITTELLEITTAQAVLN